MNCINQKNKDMEKKSFNEVSFLKSVREVEINLPNVKNDKNAKQLVRSSIINAWMDKDEVFSYIINLLETLRPEKMDRKFDVNGWKGIYNYFIKHPDYPKFGETLKSKMATLLTPFMFKECFIEWAVAYGHNPEGLLNEIKLDCIGWWDIYVLLVKKADELGIVVEKPESDEDLWKEEVKKAKEDAKAEKAKTKESKKKDSLERKDDKSSSPRRGRPRKTDSKTLKEVMEVVETKEPATTVDETPMVKISVPSTIIRDETGFKKPSTASGKRGYSIPVLQYKRCEIFPNVETASKKTGVAIEEILKSFESRPTTKVDCIWKYTNKQKKEVIQFTYLHTYKNQNDINVSSEAVCGKKIHHSNVVPKLKKEWTSISKEEFIWIQISDVISSEPEMGAVEVPIVPICEIEESPEEKFDNVEYVGYYMKGDELDLETGPFGTYNSLQQIVDDLGIYEMTLSRYFSPESDCKKLFVDMGGEPTWIGFKVIEKVKSISMESAA